MGIDQGDEAVHAVDNDPLHARPRLQAVQMRQGLAEREDDLVVVEMAREQHRHHVPARGALGAAMGDGGRHVVQPSVVMGDELVEPGVQADEGEAERIAQAIVVARKQSSLTTTQELANLVKRNVVAARRHGRIHPATKVFQALRMAVNSEAKHLEGLLAAAYEKLSPGGRMIVVAFHSGEDGLVKRAFQKWSREDEWQLLTKKPIGPSEEETRVNPRARSAKLRCIQKAEGGKPHPR